MLFSKMMGFNEAWNFWGIGYNSRKYSEIERRTYEKKYFFSKKLNKVAEKKSNKYQTFIAH